MLRIENLESGYGPMQVLWQPSLRVEAGTITSLLGPNGAGKSTLLRTVLGSIEPWGGKVFFDDEDVTHLPTHKKVGLGIALVPEGKHLFTGMTVRENLMMGAYRKEAEDHKQETFDLVYELFPILRERDSQRAGTLSGGEQQMVTIARALMTKPRLMMLDEPGARAQAGGRGLRDHREAQGRDRPDHPAGRAERDRRSRGRRLGLHHA